uniref:Uncharacterized protein MANES_04G074300 n=1 Tax=Rhizophora mucronata TaxID=61149 RepID=A0A2P2MZR6_RHIMU
MFSGLKKLSAGSLKGLESPKKILLAFNKPTISFKDCNQWRSSSN